MPQAFCSVLTVSLSSGAGKIWGGWFF